jgi:LysR family transcriptional regulator, nitrogen assimilation regulatory protein
VNLGLASTIARTVAGPFIEACKGTLPKVTLKFSDFDSESIRGLVETSNLDLALLFEDEQVSSVSRKPLFRQRLYLLRRESDAAGMTSISLSDLSKLPLVLPGQPNGRRSAIDRAFMAAGLTANVAVESGGAMSSELSAVRSGIGNAILPIGDFAGISGDGLAAPLLIEPPLFLTASVISSSDFPLTNAGEAVRNLLIQFVGQHSRGTAMPGAVWIN